MKGRVRGIFSREGRLFATPLNIFLYAFVTLIVALGILYVASHFSSNIADPAKDTAYYENKLAETQRELDVLRDPSLADGPVHDYPGRAEDLLAQIKLYEEYIRKGTSEENYIDISTRTDDFDMIMTGAKSEGESAARGALNAFPVLALGFALVCFASGLHRTATLCGGRAAKTVHLCDCSRKELYFCSAAFDWTVLGVWIAALSLFRGIFASTGTVRWFYTVRGADVAFGSIHELFFAQFLASVALGAACYFLGSLFATVAGKGRAFFGTAVSLVAVGIAVGIGFIVEYVTKGETLWFIAAPLFGISFSFPGFRSYIYFIHLALCVAVTLLSCVAAYTRYSKTIPVKQNFFTRVG